MKKQFEFAVVGGGPAGSALAALLARKGNEVVVLEKEKFPRDTLCGEFLSAESRQLLKKLDCFEDLVSAGGVEISGARFTAAKGQMMEIGLPEKALSLSRITLDWILWENASRCGADCRDQAFVKSMNASSVEVEINRTAHTFSAKKVIAAYGKRNSLDRDLKRSFLTGGSACLGLKRRHQPKNNANLDQLKGWVEIHAVNGGYCGISFVENGFINVSLLLSVPLAHRLRPMKWETVAEYLGEQNAFLRGRLAAMEPAGREEMLAQGEICFGLKEGAKDGLLFVGDAAAMIPPFCGDGIAMALRSAEILEECITRSPDSSLAGIWNDRCLKEFAFRIRLGKIVQKILFSPTGSDFFLRFLKKAPWIARWLVNATRG